VHHVEAVRSNLLAGQCRTDVYKAIGTSAHIVLGNAVCDYSWHVTCTEHTSCPETLYISVPCYFIRVLHGVTYSAHV